MIFIPRQISWLLVLAQDRNLRPFCVEKVLAEEKLAIQLVSPGLEMFPAATMAPSKHPCSSVRAWASRLIICQLDGSHQSMWISGS